MKKKLMILLLALFVLPCAFMFGGCRKMDTYNFAIMPDEDTYYSANITRTYEYTDGSAENSTYTFNVRQTSATIDGTAHNVLYIDYDAVVGTSTHLHYTVLCVYGVGENNIFYLDTDNTWKHDDHRWSSAYRNFRGFMYEDDVWGRDFPQDSKEVTDDYIQYTFKYNEETFRLANNPWHYLVYYHMKTDSFEKNHSAVVTFVNSPLAIQYVDTIHLA